MIEVFADIWCPFAHVGLTSLRRQRDERAPNTPIVVRAWPLELVNGEPQSASLAAEHVRDLRAQLGVDLFNGFRPAAFPQTVLPALALAAAAQRCGRGEAAAFRIRHALWEDGRDVGAPDVVAELAGELGVAVTDSDHQAVRDDWMDGKARGVEGSPHFFCGSASAFCPGVEIEHDEQGNLHLRADASEFESFLASCFP